MPISLCLIDLFLYTFVSLCRCACIYVFNREIDRCVFDRFPLSHSVLRCIDSRRVTDLFFFIEGNMIKETRSCLAHVLGRHLHVNRDATLSNDPVDRRHEQIRWSCSAPVIGQERPLGSRASC